MSNFPSQFNSNTILEILSQAKTATAIHSTDEMIIEMANDAMIAIWGKDKTVIGKPIEVALPELKGQPFLGLLQNVLHSGETLSGSNTMAELIVDGELKPFYFDFEYRAIKNGTGNVICVLHTATDVTDRYLSRQREKDLESELQVINEELAASNEELAATNEELIATNEELGHSQRSLIESLNDQINSKQELEKARDTLRQAIESAEIGTWTVDLTTDTLTISDQSKKIHGLPADIDITLSQSLMLIAPDHVEKVKNAIQRAVDSNINFDIEYIINPMDGSKPKWLKSTGKAYYNYNKEPVSVSGTIIDITETKIQDQQKDDFISIASHELKTPVTSLKASLQLLDRIKDDPSPQMLSKLIEQCNRSMDKISTLIEDLLNLSRMNEGQLKLNKTRFTISHMLNQCCSHVRAAGRHQLILQGDEQLQVFADEHRIDQVVVNMVNNAVKYAPGSKQIYFNVEKEGDLAKVSVTDTGPGIAPEKLSHLFERYYRTDASGYQNSGLGLGLYISAEIIRKHAGEIGVTSDLGKGSTFWFTLPL